MMVRSIYPAHSVYRSMTSFCRKLRTDAQGGSSMISFPILFLGVVTMACSLERFPETPLFKDLNSVDYDQGRAVIERRVSSKFPVGSSDAGLAEYLESQGLTVNRIDNIGLPGLPIYGKSFIVRKRSGCDMIVGVDWRADGGSIIKSISVRYSDTGCM